MYIPEELLQALKSGTMASMLGDGTGMTEVDLGMLDLPSGRLVAADPLGNDAVPFAQTVAPGRYPVILHVVRDAEGEEIVAFAEVRLNDAQPARYEMALTGEEDTSEPLEEDGFFGFEAECTRHRFRCRLRQQVRRISPDGFFAIRGGSAVVHGSCIGRCRSSACRYRLCQCSWHRYA